MARVVPLGGLLACSDEIDFLKLNNLDSLDALLDQRTGTLLQKPGLAPWRERVRIEVAAGRGTRTLYLKRFVHPPASTRRMVRRSGTGARSLAGVEWTWLRLTSAAGIGCPKPIAFGEQIKRRREVFSMLLMGGVEGCSLESLLEHRERSEEAIRLWRLATAEAVRRFHGLGLVHRDLYFSHLFVNEGAEGWMDVSLIDLHRVLRPRWFPTRWLVKDLGSLAYSARRAGVSRTHQLRWLKRYLGVSRLGGRDRVLVYRIVGKVERITAHDLRRVRRLGFGDQALFAVAQELIR